MILYTSKKDKEVTSIVRCLRGKKAPDILNPRSLS